MTKTVIDNLKAIQVDEQNRDQSTGTLGEKDGLLETIAKQNPVRQTGQDIVGCQIFEPGDI